MMVVSPRMSCVEENGQGEQRLDLHFAVRIPFGLKYLPEMDMNEYARKSSYSRYRTYTYVRKREHANVIGIVVHDNPKEGQLLLAGAPK